MEIKSTKIPPQFPQNPQPHRPGLLVGLENPPESLADEAKSVLGLSYRPSNLIIGVSPDSLKFTPYEKAVLDTGISFAKTISKQMAKSSNIPALDYGVKALWLGVGCWKLYKKISSSDKNVPALLIDSAKTGLDVVEFGLDIAGVKTEFFSDKLLQKNIELMFTAGSAATKGEDVAMAIFNKKFGATEAGKSLTGFSPILNAAISKDPAFKGIKFKPLPQINYSKI